MDWQWQSLSLTSNRSAPTLATCKKLTTVWSN